MILKHHERSEHADARVGDRRTDALRHAARLLSESRGLDALIHAIMPLEVSGEPPKTYPTRM